MPRLVLRGCLHRDASVNCTAYARYFLHHRPHHRPLQRGGKTGRRRYGRRLQSQGRAPGPQCCAEISSRRYFAGPPGHRALSPRSPRLFRAQSRQHLHHLRYRRIRRPPLHRHGAARRPDAQTSHFNQADRRGGAPGNRHSNRQRARCRAHQGHRAPRHQARQYFSGRARAGKNSRFWFGQAELRASPGRGIGGRILHAHAGAFAAR